MLTDPAGPASPLLREKHPGTASVFQPAALLRAARRQKGLPDVPVPPACVLDPDGDLVEHLRATERARPHPGWACYHTDLFVFDLPGVPHPIGVVPRAVGAPFAVLVAEQLFASGCRALLSLTAAGRIAADLPAAPHYVLVERALRDEGTSHHYLSPGPFAACPEPGLVTRVHDRLAKDAPELILRSGATWTTDAPYRETPAAIAAARHAGCLAVEMEAAALYAFAAAADQRVLCVAHVTNALGQDDRDFEKGEAEGAPAALRLLGVALREMVYD